MNERAPAAAREITIVDDNPLSPGAHEIDADGVAQVYHVAGSGPICLIHSGGPGFSWEYLRMPLVERGVTAVYVEPVGTGDSGRLDTHPHGYTLDRYGRMLDTLLEHLGLSTAKVHLLGHSHGSFVAQHHAARHSDRLAGLILYETAASVGREHFADTAANFEAFADRHSDDPRLPAVLDAWRAVPHIADDESFLAVAQDMFPVFFADYWGRENEFAATRAAMTASFISGLDDSMRPDLIDGHVTLGSIAAPTLVIVGRYDVVCGVRGAREIADLIPDARLLELKAGGHFGHLEEPERFAAAVIDFVAATP